MIPSTLCVAFQDISIWDIDTPPAPWRRLQDVIDRLTGGENGRKVDVIGAYVACWPVPKFPKLHGQNI